MCILRIPQHPWCHCTDPSAVDTSGNLKCTHHIWIRPDSIPLPTPTSTTTPTTTTTPEEFQLEAFLAKITRPGPHWEHCTTYTLTHAHPTPEADDELLCPETLRLQAANKDHGHKRFYAWDGLCAHCNHPDHAGLELSLFPLAEHWALQPATIDLGAEHQGELVWVELVPGEYEYGFMVWDGSKVPEGLEKKLIAACEGGQGLYVDVVVGEGGAVYQGRSGVYLMPGHYDITLLWEVNREEKKGWFEVGAEVVGQVVVDGVSKLL
ncbi:hypothetical protein C8A00DRAFT_17416 [Chaetomidium leptoderma]|uniref:Uncharacterized protein n=1 Tax=Chaetomidium leptoderma TaxID=669021 RepID=A0AAN6VGM4_9PEZI|nr:hypothetical protein C8A00DRAFT_17416 [Chaetomidium leptoderma]